LELRNLTRVKILPTGVESKKNIGALKIAEVKLEKKAIEAFNPRLAARTDLIYINTALSNENNEKTPIKMPLVTFGISMARASQ